MADRRTFLAVAAAFIALLVGCAAQVAAPGIDKQEPAEFPAAYYRGLLAQGRPVFRVDPSRSLVVIEVRRGGSLAQFGHDHVVTSHDAEGSIAPEDGRADLWVPLDALVVDEPQLRTEAGFDTQPSPDDIAGTRRNMLERVLETDRYPYALVSLNEIGVNGGAKRLRVTVTLHGTTRSVETEAQLDKTADEVSAAGTIAIDQSQFGITPFSVFGGAIAVQDRVNIRFRIRARRIEYPARPNSPIALNAMTGQAAQGSPFGRPLAARPRPGTRLSRRDRFTPMPFEGVST